MDETTRKAIAKIWGEILPRYYEEVNRIIDANPDAYGPDGDPDGNEAGVLFMNADDDAWREATNIYKTREENKMAKNNMNTKVTGNVETKGEKKMKDRIVTKNTKANANVKKNNKEEKEMTKAASIKAAIAAQRKLMEDETGKSFAVGEQTPERFASKDSLGANKVTLKSLDLISVKYNAKTAEEAPKFMKAIELTINEDEKVLINYNMFLYKGEEKQEVNIFDAIVTAKGDEGCYITVNEDAYEKPVDELTEEDIEFHALDKEERIWIPAKKEFRALQKQLGIAEIEFDDEGHADIPEQEVILYVYEDAVKDKALKVAKKGTNKGKIRPHQVINYFYNASFIAPEDQPNMKYGRRFTTSEDANHRAELAELPGVQLYLANC